MWRTITRFRQSFCASSRLNKEGSPNSTCSLRNVAENQIQLWYVGARQFNKKCCRGSESNNGEERRDHRARHDRTYFHNDWLDALGWRCVFLLSWYMCQPLCINRQKKHNPAEVYAYDRLSKSSPSDCSYLVKSISSLILESPAKYVLPTVQAVKSRKPSSTEGGKVEPYLIVNESLEAAHKKVTRSLQNYLGTECMQEGKHDKAFAYFSEAAQFDDAPALFNLAICYEMGLGTKQSFRKAADLYKRAAALGHATAMYNLGVFHVHGWGGIVADEVEARKLFMEAADLGQLDAKRALNADEEDSSESESECEDYQYFYRDLEPRTNDTTTLWYRALNINVDNSSKHQERLSSTDSGINDQFSPCDWDLRTN